MGTLDVPAVAFRVNPALPPLTVLGKELYDHGAISQIYIQVQVLLFLFSETGFSDTLICRAADLVTMPQCNAAAL